jgi:hypothetical protein
MWKYSLIRKEWYPIRHDFNPETQFAVQAPSGRYGLAGVYVQLEDLESMLDTKY